MTKTTREEAINLTDVTRNVTRNNSSRTLIFGIPKERREMSWQFQTRVCAGPHTNGHGPQIHDHGHSSIVWNKTDWLKKRLVTAPISPPTNPGEYNGTTHLKLEVHMAAQLAWNRCKLAQSATKKMGMHLFKEYHFLELQDDQYVQPEDITNQITELHKILKQNYDPNKEPQLYYKAVQDTRNTLE